MSPTSFVFSVYGFCQHRDVKLINASWKDTRYVLQVWSTILNNQMSFTCVHCPWDPVLPRTFTTWKNDKNVGS